MADAGGKATKDLLGEIPHLIVVILLVLVLLFVVTKFKWVHCSQIPQWCDVYCSINGKSQVAIIHGPASDAGLGDASALHNQILTQRKFTYSAMFEASQLSQGLLDDYELVILTHVKNISLRQAITLRDYLDRGGSILWEGDAGSSYVLTQEDESYALAENLSNPGYYEYYEEILNSSAGFGLLGDALGIKYLGNVPKTGGARFYAVKLNHLILSGVKNFELPPAPFAKVTENPAVLTKVAEIELNGVKYPALLERKYIGRIIYVAIPLEYVNSRTLTSNALDYLVSC